MTEGNELVSAARYDYTALMRLPEQVIAEAKRAADELKRVVSSKPKKVTMNGEQYLEFEDWQTVGKFYGITAKVESTTFIDLGGARGFEARAVALTADGRVISAADAMCLNDEPKWSTRAKYEYQGGKRVKTGDEPVPLFQLRSMAQTRACAKALRNVLSWVVVLAGYKTTPAEELQGSSGSGKGSSSRSNFPQGGDDTLSEGQKKMVFAKSKAKGIKEDDIKAAFKVADIGDIKKNQVNAVIAFIDNGVMPEGA